jgi:murein DD-endopeptidase MepM/ murein hydrolase activator NlpD
LALSIGELTGYLTLDDSKFEKGLKGAQGDLDKTGTTMGSKAKKIGLAVGAALAAGAVVAAKALYEIGGAFDDMSDTIRVGTGATGKALDALNASAKKVGTQVPADFKDVGTAIADVNTRLGHTGKPLEDISAQFLELSRITGTDVSANIENVSRVFGDWGVEADKQSETLDYLFKVSQSTGIGIDSLSQKVVQFGAPMRQFGFSFEESAALMGKWEKEGVNTETIMSGLRAGLGKLAKAGEDPAKAFAKVTQQIQNAGSTGKATGIAIETFGQRAGPDLAAAVREGRFSLDDLMGTLDASSETIMGAGKDTMDFAEQWVMFKNKAMLTLEPVAVRVFGIISDAMEWINTNGIPTMKNFGKWVGENEKPIKIVGGVLASILIPLLIAAGVQATISATKQAAAWVVTQAGAIKTGVVYTAQTALMVAKWAWMGVQAMLHAAKIAAAWLISMGPIGLVIAAVVGLTAVVVKNWEKIREVIAAGWNWVREKSVATWDAVSRAVSGAWRSVREGTREATLWVLERALWFAEKMLGAMAKAFGWAPGIGEKLKKAHEKVKNFRQGVNAELDRVKDKDVWINIGVRAPGADPAGNVGRNRDLVNALRPSGGAGGMGGSGITPRVNASAAGARGIATDAQGQMGTAAAAIEKVLTEKFASQAGRVLPKGSYSIGMPYLGYPGHYGADYPAGTGTPVYAMGSGTVARAMSLSGSYGRHVYLSHPSGVETRYAHLNSYNVAAGQAIAAGQQIGTVGSTGNSTGPHLHFEYRTPSGPKDPAGLGLFDHGGYASGAGLMVKGPQPERVLSPRQTDSFERLVDVLDRSGGSGQRPIELHVHSPSGTPQQMARAAALQLRMSP